MKKIYLIIVTCLFLLTVSSCSTLQGDPDQVAIECARTLLGKNMPIGLRIPPLMDAFIIHASVRLLSFSSEKHKVPCSSLKAVF